ncbi:MAG TPA: DNA translocase FtsK 4TM domain-containing protein [Hyphomicrobiaceae bacterium]|nr:DNA translocase FtsK 4TM domain-containing protein [Hyphomicrobiaceae bacterium]
MLRATEVEQRLLPASLEDRLIGWLGRCGGALLLTIVGAVWLSLLTWSLADPSLTHATAGHVQNWLGAPGAVVSDLFLQTLGLATAVALLPPMFWGIELAFAERVTDFRSKVAFYPLAVLVLAGAFAALPVPAAWPLQHACGGLVGDVIYEFGVSVLALVNPVSAGAVVGLLFFAAGFSALGRSIGLELKDVVAAASSWRRSSWRAAGATWHDNVRAEAQSLGRHLATMVSIEGAGRMAARSIDGWWGARREPVFGPPAPRESFEAERLPPEAEHAVDGHAAEAHADGYGPGVLRDDFAPADEAAEPGREPAFDVDTDLASRAIAERFAPAHARAAVAATPRARPKTDLLGGLPFMRAEAHYKRPAISLLKRSAGPKPGAEFTQTALRGTARLLEDVLADFGVKGEVRDIKPGPVVTLFEFEPARGTKSSRVIALADDIARSMSAASVRVAIVPGRNAIGIELPNVRREPVLLREILEGEAFRTTDAALPLALGKSIGGEPIVADLARMPHLLVAGTTGSGKSVGVNAMILSLLFRHSPDECRFLMIDPKMLELSAYNGIAHLLCPVVTEPQKAVAALNWAVLEMEERYKRMSALSVRNIEAFNHRVTGARKRGETIARTVQTGFDAATGQAVYERQELAPETMPYIVVVIDELADLMIVAGKDIEAAVQRLAQMARAAGIHLIMATQRPSVDIITGTIKANFPTRISFKVASKIDSRTILNEQGAEQLLGHGDMLYASGAGQMVRVHGPFVSDEEVESIAEFLRGQGEPRYVAGIGEAMAMGEEPGTNGRPDGHDDLFDRAVAIVLRDRKASTSYIQRRLSVGYNRAADLVERMEREGLISAPNHAGKREILANGRAGAAAGI